MCIDTLYNKPLPLSCSYSMVGRGHVTVSMVTGDAHASFLAEHVEEAEHQAQSSSSERLVLKHVEQSDASAGQLYNRTGITVVVRVCVYAQHPYC